MKETDWVLTIVTATGVLVAVIQALGLFILSDIRSRVARLETNIMEGNRK